ncbi:glycosyltransferase family 4 protein [Chryseobacterium sp. MEBOG07]|uniref:glycosyltransferase family 4 protein n=1 Tax=Chryseobacterium sp. MEBOG07 TaxID=2879939 RepID=UPI001F2DA057|nr:glycosyltransferase family 4 protein [Chryseobacterium sp. MEBOG07]UKB80682.1 glycosyltransferase family 4 protein [Chryseobacterium sp. MEBOG07]
MKIAFCTIADQATMYRSLIEEFKNQGHEVTVIAPIYEKETEYIEKDGIKTLFFNSLPILNTGLIKRGIGNILFPYKCLKAIKKNIKKEKFDLILMTTPPLGFFEPIRYLKKVNKNAKFYIILRDIHPEGAKLVGLHKIKPLFYYFRTIEKKLYDLADYIGCMSPGNIEFLKEKNPQLDFQKLRLLPNWEPATEFINPDQNFLKKYNFENKFIVVFGGNMGITQNLDIFLQLAKEKENLENVLFLLIGTGTEMERLKNKSLELKLKNTLFLNQIPRDDYNELMKNCALGFISLSPKVHIPNYPSKSLGYLGAKLPILASIDAITDYGQDLLDKYNCGLWSLADNFDHLSKNFDTLYNNKDLRMQMGENGYEALKNFSPEITYEKIIKTYQSGNSGI